MPRFRPETCLPSYRSEPLLGLGHFILPKYRWGSRIGRGNNNNTACDANRHGFPQHQGRGGRHRGVSGGPGGEYRVNTPTIFCPATIKKKKNGFVTDGARACSSYYYHSEKSTSTVPRNSSTQRRARLNKCRHNKSSGRVAVNTMPPGACTVPVWMPPNCALINTKHTHTQIHTQTLKLPPPPSPPRYSNRHTQPCLPLEVTA